MKKNVMMRVASVLLICVLLTSSVISGTFAKYVTTASGSDSARVAKWGVSVDPKGNLFLEDYAKTDGTYTVSGNTVESIDTWKVVAPGTGHGLTEVVLSGAPEVATRITYVADVTLSGWVVGGVEYCPIIFTVEGHTYGMYGTTAEYTFGTIAVLEQAVEEAIAACKADYAPNTNLADAAVTAAFPTVSWEWPFYTSDENDVKDTALGDAAAAGYPAGITVTIQTTVTQID